MCSEEGESKQQPEVEMVARDPEAMPIYERLNIREVEIVDEEVNLSQIHDGTNDLVRKSNQKYVTCFQNVYTPFRKCGHQCFFETRYETIEDVLFVEHS